MSPRRQDLLKRALAACLAAALFFLAPGTSAYAALAESLPEGAGAFEAAWTPQAVQGLIAGLNARTLEGTGFSGVAAHNLIESLRGLDPKSSKDLETLRALAQTLEAKGYQPSSLASSPSEFAGALASLTADLHSEAAPAAYEPNPTAHASAIQRAGPTASESAPAGISEAAETARQVVESGVRNLGLKALPALALGVPVPAGAAELAAHPAPLSHAPLIAGAALTAYAAHAAAKKAFDAIGSRRGWEPDTISLRKNQAGMALYGLGALAVFSQMGVSVQEFVGKLGALAAIAGGDIFNNVLEAGRVILGRAFNYGDLVRIGSEKYVIHCFSMEHILLTKPGDKRPSVFMLYTQLAQSPITVLREAPRLSPRENLKALGGAFLPSFAYFFKSAASPARLKTAAAAAVLCAAVVGLTLAPAAAALPWLAPVLVAVRSFALFEAVMYLGRGADVILRNMAARRAWPMQNLDSVALPMQLGFWALGGVVALKSLGVPWSAFGWATLGLGVVTQDLLGGLWRWFLIRFGWELGLHGYMRIGDTVTVGKITGKVSGLSPFYLELTQRDGKKSFINYSLVSTFKSKSVADRLGPR